MIEWMYQPPAGRNEGEPTGFRYMWMKTVRGFQQSRHCAQCLIGGYDKRFGLSMAAGFRYEAHYHEGTLLYLCGVSTPYRWERNFHLAGKVKAGAEASVDLYTGARIVVAGLEQIKFDDGAARRLFPELGEEFLTCRNFQFAAQVFGRRA